MKAKQPRKRKTVNCDDDCGAFVRPRTLEECKAALRHWRDHEFLSGCSHAR